MRGHHSPCLLQRRLCTLVSHSGPKGGPETLEVLPVVVTLFPVVLCWPLCWPLCCPAKRPLAGGLGSLLQPRRCHRLSPAARSCLSRRKRHAARSPVSRNYLDTLAGWELEPFPGLAVLLAVTERGAVQLLVPVPGHNELLWSKAGLQQLLLLPLLPKGTLRKADLCSGLFNFVWHFTAKGKVL